MKTLAGIVLIIVVFATTAYSQHAPYPAPRVRHADSVRNAFVGSWGPFDVGIYKAGGGFRADSLNRFGNDFNEVHIDTLRYVNLPADLNLNAEDRDPYDYPSNHPAPRDTVLGGDHEKYDDILILEPHQLVDAFNCASYMRFEFERHHREKDSLEYPGFYNHGTASGAVSLTGRNSTDITAEPCFWIVGSSRASDRDTTCLKLKAGTDAAGIFDDSLWHPQFINSNNNSPVRYFTGGFYNKRLLLRCRVRVDDSVNTALKPVLFIMHTKFQQLDSSLVNREDTFRVDSKFKNIIKGFDTIERRFIMPLKTVDGKLVDNTKAIFFSFQWPGTISMTADWMEVMTAHCDSTNADSLMLYGTPNGFPEAAAYSAEDFLAKTTPALDTLIKRIVDAYSGHIDYLRIGDEFGLAAALPYQRLVQRVRALSHDSIEVTEFTQDSTSSIFGIGLPNQQGVMFEGVRKGILDSGRYADPKMMMYDLYAFFADDALPKRTTATTDTGILAWEKRFAPRSGLNLRQGNSSDSEHYTRIIYLKQYQFKMYPYYLQWNREARRLTERNPGMHYGLTWGAGNGADIFSDSAVAGDTCLMYAYPYREITGAEMKETGHLAMSCGSRGLVLYFLGNAADNVPSQNGGIMSDHGFHDTNYHTFTIDKITQSLWMGWKERYDSVKSVNPILIKYGTTLIGDTCIGDWTAAELHNYPLRDSLPFRDTIATLDDSFRKDAFKINHSSDNSPDTANRTFVHISMWLDTTSAAKATHSDTLLYITNMRTDDSYDTTAVPSTIDRRFITLKMKARHLIFDVFDTFPSLNNARIKTPFVRGGDSLRIQLLPGDGILVRLFDGDTMHVAVNFPKGGQDFNNYGGINFDKPLLGTTATSSGYHVPSTNHTYVGIRDIDTVSLWQDSLVYVKVDNIDSTRKGYWRQQNWLAGDNSNKFAFKNTLTLLSNKVSQISTDSLAHNIVIRTDLEGLSSNGKIKVHDPFLVDSATLKNVNDTLAKSSPFLPHVLNANRGLGVDSEHYGGVFLKQNVFRDTTTPIYTVKAFTTITSGSYVSEDSLPGYTDWSFIEWATNDTTVSGDTLVWKTDPDGTKVWFGKDPALVFGKDSAIYTARYKAHTAAYTDADFPLDSGNCCNNQRKLYYIGSDSIGRKMFRYVFSSAGRIYTSVGTKTGVDNNAIIWTPEQLVSGWNDAHLHYPAVGIHNNFPEKYHYVYQNDGGGNVDLAMIDSLGASHEWVVSGIVDNNFATPVVASFDPPTRPIDIVAWAANSSNGVRVDALSWAQGATSAHQSNNEVYFGLNQNPLYPTIWTDTCYYCAADSFRTRFWLAWQQDTIIDTVHNITRTDVCAVQYELIYGPHNGMGLVPSPGTASNVVDVSWKLNPLSTRNTHPCIAGFETSASPQHVQLKLAYESLYSPDSVSEQGIEICNDVINNPASPAGWQNTNFITSLSDTNYYWKPSIEVSHYHKADTGRVVHGNWYSLLHEILGGRSIRHWAFEGNTERLVYDFLNLQDPQIAVTPTKVDSDLYRMAMTPSGGEPRWLISGYSGTYKIGTNDSLWGYHAVTEKDTGSKLLIEYGFGELAFDNGNGMTPFDLLDREDTLAIDSLHPKEYFMQSVNFTLPAGGTVQYCPWIRPSDASLYRSRFDTLIYALDFFDTAGAYQFRIDSIALCDSSARIRSILRTISINRDSDKLGYAVFHRVTGFMADSEAMPQNIITQKRLSTVSSYKQRTGAQHLTSAKNDITLVTAPNPFKEEVSVYLGIPEPGLVTIEAYNALGNTMGYLCKDRLFTNGMHQLVWKAGKLPSGIYILRMRFGNEVVTARVVAIE